MESFALEIYTQEERVLEARAVSLIVPAIDGYLGVLAHHAPLVTVLGEGQIQVKLEDEAKERRISMSGGFLEVSDNRATLLADRIDLKSETE